jgi:SAM-dependent methyltransferase
MRAFATSIDTGAAASAVGIGRCIACAADLEGCEECPGCGRVYHEVGGIVDAIGPLRGTNRIAARFYDGPCWPRFKPWEQLFLWCQGPGPARARRQVLRHLPGVDRARVLEVGIGAGANLPFLPRGWTVYGVDIARSQLELCRDRHPSMSGRLVLAEGEALPFADASFDAVYTVGGFNYFRDPIGAIHEMRRVARPGAPLVVADEDPNLIRFALGRILELDLIDRWSLRAMGLDAEFITMVQNYQLDVAAVARTACPGHRRFPIWNRLGYCLVYPAPAGDHLQSTGASGGVARITRYR